MFCSVIILCVKPQLHGGLNWCVSSSSLPEHELQEESRNLEEEQETAGKDTATPFQPICFMQIVLAHSK